MNEVTGYVEAVPVSLGAQILIDEQRRKALNFNELWRQVAIFILANAEVNDEKSGVRSLAGRLVSRKDGSLGVLAKIRLDDHIHEFFAGLEKLLGKRFRYEDRRLGDLERCVVVGGPEDVVEEGLVFFLGKMGVVGLADVGDHS